tara:strand:+ start:426 stop:884 length:459 start_codon:yes stop_codon:yes gene_type:complete
MTSSNTPINTTAMKTLKLYLETLTAPSTTIEVVLQLAENVAHEAVAAVIAEKQSMQKPGRMAEMEDAMREEEWEFYRRFFVDVRTADDDDDHEDDGDYRRSMSRIVENAEEDRSSMLQTHNRLRDRLAKREGKRKSDCMLATEEGEKKARAE